MTRDEYLDWLNADRQKIVSSASLVVQRETPNVDLVMGSIPGTLFKDKDGDLWERVPDGIRCIEFHGQRNNGEVFEHIHWIADQIRRHGPFVQV